MDRRDDRGDVDQVDWGGGVNGIELVREAVERALDVKGDDEGVEVAVYITSQQGTRCRLVRRLKTAPNHTPAIEDGDGWVP